MVETFLGCLRVYVERMVSMDETTKTILAVLEAREEVEPGGNALEALRLMLLAAK